MIANARTCACDPAEPRDLEFGLLAETELAILSLLIDRRRCLPVYLGDTWRCYVCGLERVTITAMADHVLEAHKPEPFNEEDAAELMTSRQGSVPLSSEGEMSVTRS